jgi:hypothetical protein
MLRLTEVASQSETFVKRKLRKAKTKTSREVNYLIAPPAGDTLEMFSLDRPPLLAVMRVGLLQDDIRDYLE